MNYYIFYFYKDVYISIINRDRFLTAYSYTGFILKRLESNFVVVQLLSHIQLLRSHGVQHARPPCPSPTPGVCSNSCPLNQWCHPTISSSVIPFSSHLQSFPASGSFLKSRLFTSGSQRNFSFNISPSNEYSGKQLQDSIK